MFSQASFSQDNSFEPLIHANKDRRALKDSVPVSGIPFDVQLSTFLSAMMSADKRFELNCFG